MESYLTLKPDTELKAEIQEKRSRFIAHLIHVESTSDACAHQRAIHAHYYDARHNVPAWILATGQSHASDDGEPSQSAGQSVLDVLQGAHIADVSCVITRYFGGIKLGVGGLKRAYSAVTHTAVQQAEEKGVLVAMCKVAPLTVLVSYSEQNSVVSLARQLGGRIEARSFTECVSMTILFKTGEEEPFLQKLRDLLSGREQVTRESLRFVEW